MNKLTLAKKWKIEGELFDQVLDLERQYQALKDHARAAKRAMFDVIAKKLDLPEDTLFVIDLGQKDQGFAVIEECEGVCHENGFFAGTFKGVKIDNA
jgi:hypothetical protein